MPYRLTIPARVNVLGNPADACEGDFATISAAVDIYAGARIEPAHDLVLDMLSGSGGDAAVNRRLTYPRDAFPLPYDGEFDLVKGALNRLHYYSTEFRKKVSRQGVRIGTWTDVPRQSGLGGSSLLVLLALAGMRAFYGLDPQAVNDYVLAELAQQVEARELGITCGFADRYVPLFGGIAYVDYHGKLHQRGLGAEPLATYERLDDLVADLPLVAVSSGVERDSGDVHGRMRPRYLEEYAAWTRQGGAPPPMVRFMTKVWETAWRGKIALLAADWEMFGRLMNENHRAVDEMMAYCGFSDGAGWVNTLFIDAALANGALGAKLTGAGGGGSVFALVHPGDQEALVAAWRQTAAEAGLSSARVYHLHVARHGLTVEEM